MTNLSSEGGHSRREAYAAWALAQEDLPVFHQPRWLDIVAPHNWDASSQKDQYAQSAWAWPYVVKKRGSLSWIGPPDSTPYLGPWAVGHTSAKIELFDGLGYAVATIHQPQLAWSFGKAVRGMATQIVGLNKSLILDSDLNRLLRKSQSELELRILSSPKDLDEAKMLADATPRATSHGMLDHLARAATAGFGTLITAHSSGADADSDQLEGIIGLLFDRQTCYMPLLLRAPQSHSSTATALIHAGIQYARNLGLAHFDCMSGYLPGVQRFHARFGAQPSWYGQIRVSNSMLWKGLETFRSLTNPKRI